MEVLIVFGFTAFFAWYFLIIVGYPAYFPNDQPILTRRIIQLMSLVGMLAGSVFALHKPKDYERTAYNPLKTVSWAAVSCIIPIFVMLDASGVNLPAPIIGAAMIATGFGAGYFVTGWENLCARDRMSDVLVSIGTIMVIGLVLFFIVSVFMTPLAQGVMGVLLALVGAVLFYGVSKRRKPLVRGKDAKSKQKAKAAEAQAEQDEEVQDEDLRGTFNTKLSALLFMANIPLGFGLAEIYLFEPLFGYIAVGVAALALTLFVVAVRASKIELTFVTLLRFVIGASAIALLLTGISNELSLATSIILIAVWLVLRLAHAVTILKLTKVQKVPPVYLAVKAKQPGYLGFACGFIIAMLVIAFTDGRPALAIAGLVIVGILVVAALALLPFSENYTKQLAVLPVVIDTRMSTAEDIEHAKCAEIAKRFSLSPREEEILFFIVKGRNAKFIAEKLVISESTAKTHIHNIYKKSGIHSQQKFIDLMDEII